ncbi:hypothetical protein [Sphingopyxis yananensis]|uniref:hypothetical protein n=1 Tax=Sphingopyxis yananensis TaxID=2886687 RepID=UPI001D1097FB|nr:hypothetical protein [Sphingopyxis yananensis]MCC2603002.1 hypothetical protein [Sphingopyxis yananensis]
MSKGRSYPLKPSELESAILESGLQLPVEFTRWDKFDPVLEANYYPDGSRSGRSGEFIWVYCKAVESASAKAVNARLLSEALPSFLKWAKHIEGLDARSPVRREKQSFSFPLETTDN